MLPVGMMRSVSHVVSLRAAFDMHLCHLCRKRAELEEQLIVEEVERRVKEESEKRVSAAMDSEAVQQSLQQRLVAERKVLEEQVILVSWM